MLPVNPRQSFTGNFIPDFVNEEVLHDAICEFLNKRLGQWAVDPKYHGTENLEDDLTDWLSNFLNTHAEIDLPTIAFTNQQRQPRKRSVDLGIRPRPIDGIRIGSRSFHRDEPISTIEAKRLPTPDIRRRREYVVGDRIKNGRRARSGGIERYKENDHGEGSSYAYIFGYIQSDPEEGDWIGTVNTWISEVSQNPPKGTNAAWSSADQLRMVYQDSNNRLSALESQHSRIDATIVKLNHFWLNLTLIPKKTV